MIKTVGDLIKKLREFNPEAQLDIDVSWYDRHNYNHAHRDIWRCDGGIELCVMEVENGIVQVSNMNTEDVCLYEE